MCERGRVLHEPVDQTIRRRRTPQNRGVSPLSSPTLTRLDPALPLLWRDPGTLQLGDGETSTRVSVEATWVELLLSRMRTGFRRSAFDVIAHGLGAPRDEARALLARLEDVLVDDSARPIAAWVESMNIRDGRTEYRMREALADEHVLAGDRSRRDHIGIILVEGAAAAVQLARYLRDDVTHLPVAFERGRVSVGPLVTPGATPCLACRDAQERDRDPAWPRLHAQLIERDAGLISAARVAEAALMAAQVLALSGTSDETSTIGVSANGSRAWRPVTFHEDCRCRARWYPSQPGNATEPAHPGLRSETTSAPASARRA